MKQLSKNSIEFLKDFERRRPDFMKKLDYYRKFIKTGNEDNPIIKEAKKIILKDTN